MIKIEVTGNTIPELADKLLAIGASLQNTVTVYDTPARKTPPKKVEVMLEVAKAAPVDPTPAPKSAPAVTTTESLRTTAATSSTPAASASEDEELEVVDLPITLDFETVVRPLVLKVVDKRGKPFMEAILSTFGVAKASMIKPALLPKLVGLCHEALA